MNTSTEAPQDRTAPVNRMADLHDRPDVESDSSSLLLSTVETPRLVWQYPEPFNDRIVAGTEYEARPLARWERRAPTDLRRACMTHLWQKLGSKPLAFELTDGRTIFGRIAGVGAKLLTISRVTESRTVEFKYQCLRRVSELEPMMDTAPGSNNGRP